VIFEEYLREKKLGHPQNSEELASVLKSFYFFLSPKYLQINNKTIIEFGSRRI
jgi:hypothetical protein